MIGRFSMDGWNLFHKSIVYAFILLGVFLAGRAIAVVDGGYVESEVSFTVRHGSPRIWEWVTDNRKRVSWEAHVIDIARLRGEAREVDSTRFVFWRTERLKRWTSVEATLAVEPQRLFQLYRESDFAERNFTVTIEPVGVCDTKITFKELVKPLQYGRRYWAFLTAGDYSDRLQASADALRYWLDQEGPCTPTRITGP